MDMLVVTRKGDPVRLTAWGDTRITYADLQEVPKRDERPVYELGTLHVLPKQGKTGAKE